MKKPSDLWRYCIAIAAIEFFISSAMVGVFLSKGTPLATVLMVLTLVTQILVVPFVIGFTVPAVMTTIKKMDLTLEIGQKSSESLSKLQDEFVPVLSSLKTGIGNLTELVEKVKHGNGELKETVRKAVTEARVLIKDGESEIERYVFTKIDQFLSGAFQKSEENNGT